MKKKDIYLVIDATDKCDRGCSHCMFDSKPSGNSFFTSEMAQIIVEEVKKFDEKIKIRFCITGGGEPLMNPDLVKIFDVFFASKKINFATLITSGFLSKNKEESKLLGQLAKRPYAGKIDFTLSFNKFNATFIERCKNSLLLICQQKRPRYISINLALSNKTTIAAYKEIREVFGYVSENVRQDNALNGIRLRSLDYKQPFLREIVKTDYLTKTLYGRKTFIDILSVSFLCDAFYTFLSRTHKNKLIRVAPFTIVNIGNAKKLDEELNDYLFCSTAFQTESKSNKLSIDSAGNFYPQCCSKLKIGKLGQNSIQEILKKADYLKENILKNLIADQRTYPENEICNLCEQVVAEKLS